MAGKKPQDVFPDMPDATAKAIAPYYVLATSLSESAYVNKGKNPRKPLPEGTRNTKGLFEGMDGYWQNSNSRMRVMESEDGRTLIVSFCGSDDKKDFIQDANDMKGLKNLSYGQKLALGATMGGAIAYSTVKDTEFCSTAKNGFTKTACNNVAILSGMSAMPWAAAGTAWAMHKGDKFGGPEQAYASLSDGVAYTSNFIKANGDKYDKIIVTGHSLGGNLATQFVGEMAKKNPEALAKTDLLTINSLGLSNDIPKGLHRTLFFRQKNDITDIVQTVNGLKTIPPLYVISVAGKIDSDARQAFSGMGIARRHSVVNEGEKAVELYAKVEPDKIKAVQKTTGDHKHSPASRPVKAAMDKFKAEIPENELAMAMATWNPNTQQRLAQGSAVAQQSNRGDDSAEELAAMIAAKASIKNPNFAGATKYASAAP